MTGRFRLALALLLVLSACSNDDEIDISITLDPDTSVVFTAPPQTAAPGTGGGPKTGVTTTTEAPPPTHATQDDPVPLGESVLVGDWEVTVLSAIPDATDLVMTENEFNDPPAEGSQSFIVEVAATYLGDGSEPLFAGVSFSAVGNAAVVYDFDFSCGVIPDGVSSFRPVFTGGTITGTLCWHVAQSDAESLTLTADSAFGINEDDRRFLAIPTDGRTYTAPDRLIPVAEGGDSGERGNPIPAGVTTEVGDWEITILGSTPDATDAVLAENPFNDPPPEGSQSVIVEISATFLGQGATTLLDDLTISTLGPSSVAYQSEFGCGVIPNPLDTFGEVSAGGALTGNLCWQVLSSDVDALLVMVDALESDLGEVFFAIR